MYVSQENPRETDIRLLRVIAAADLKHYTEPYCFREWPLAAAPDVPAALALVRDDAVWSSLQPAGPGDPEPFGLFRFHFPPGLDNSGFVGWLASRVKAELGSGLFVVCGQNSAKGGIFDYWGCPWAVRREVAALLERLRSERS